MLGTERRCLNVRSLSFRLSLLRFWLRRAQNLVRRVHHRDMNIRAYSAGNSLRLFFSQANAQAIDLAHRFFAFLFLVVGAGTFRIFVTS